VSLQREAEVEPLPITTAIEAFLRGVSFTRSFTKPYAPTDAGAGVWVMADAPDAKPPPRNSEFVAYGASPESVMEAIRDNGASRHSLCVLLDDTAEIDRTVAAYKALGYRFMGREPLFTLRLAERRGYPSPAVRRIRSAEDAERIAKAARSRQILPRHLAEDDSDCRLFAVFEGDRPIGRVSSVRTHADCAWVSSLFVAADHRRKGIGRSLMSAMLEDDARLGIKWSVLLASSAGTLLYPHLGYRQQGLLLIFTPKRAK